MICSRQHYSWVSIGRHRTAQVEFYAASRGTDMMRGLALIVGCSGAFSFVRHSGRLSFVSISHCETNNMPFTYMRDCMYVSTDQSNLPPPFHHERSWTLRDRSDKQALQGSFGSNEPHLQLIIYLIIILIYSIKESPRKRALSSFILLLLSWLSESPLSCWAALPGGWLIRTSTLSRR